MKMKTSTSIALATVLALGVSTQAFAQGAPQTIVQYSVDVAKVSNGYRASKIIGAKVYNEANEEIGKIDDLIVNREDRVPYATVSVGGFLGMGDSLVVVPFSGLNVTNERVVLSDGGKAKLKMLPKFTYATK
jgi:sporulation protein YlmC with PRC-barrel domain